MNLSSAAWACTSHIPQKQASCFALWTSRWTMWDDIPPGVEDTLPRTDPSQNILRQVHLNSILQCMRRFFMGPMAGNIPCISARGLVLLFPISSLPQCSQLWRWWLGDLGLYFYFWQRVEEPQHIWVEWPEPRSGGRLFFWDGLSAVGSQWHKFM